MYYLRVSDSRLESELKKEDKNFKLHQLGHDYIRLNDPNLKIKHFEKWVDYAELSSIELGSEIEVVTKDRKSIYIGRGRKGILVSVVAATSSYATRAQTGYDSQLEKIFHLFSNHPQQYHLLPARIRNSKSESKKFLKEIFIDLEKRIILANEMVSNNKNIVIDLTSENGVQILSRPSEDIDEEMEEPSGLGLDLSDEEDEDNEDMDKDESSYKINEFLKDLEMDSEDESDEEVQIENKNNHRNDKMRLCEKVVALLGKHERQKQLLVKKKRELAEIRNGKKLEKMIVTKNEYFCKQCHQVMEIGFQETHKEFHFFLNK